LEDILSSGSFPVSISTGVWTGVPYTRSSFSSGSYDGEADGLVGSENTESQGAGDTLMMSATVVSEFVKPVTVVSELGMSVTIVSAVVMTAPSVTIGFSVVIPVVTVSTRKMLVTAASPFLMLVPFSFTFVMSVTVAPIPPVIFVENCLHLTVYAHLHE